MLRLSATMALSRVILASLLAVSVIVTFADAAKIAAFNIQILGRTKMNKPEVVDILKEIIHLYDLVLIQEIRDIAQTVIYELLVAVNGFSSHKYKIALGPRVGRTRSKEQYAYFYRDDMFSVKRSFTYSDPRDQFEREPFVALFTSIGTSTSVSEFSVIGLHSKPTDAVNELDLMPKVYDDAVAKFDNRNSILMGDFNAGCRYVSSTKLGQISLWTNSTFEWIIPNDADTTVKSSTCAYDRIVLAGADVKEHHGPGVVFDFETYYNIDYDLAVDVSDHYPVSFELN